MTKAIDLTGQRFGMLTVIEKTGLDGKGRSRWLCKCDCGGTSIVRLSDLRGGQTKSCGCLRSITMRAMVFKHGGKGTRLYRIWKCMKTRCNNPNHPSYKNHGARGIKICEDWLKSFEAFRDWALANGYQDDLTIDRKDNDGNYEPGNCRWATYTEQLNNRRPRKKVV